MKFSVVIPTRNRLEYLKTAVASILDQDYNNFEIVISDNNSTQDIEGYVLSLNDKRIHYSRTDKFISVTENWNRALNQSSGEYTILIGDDDCLMKGCFSILCDLIQKHSKPDLVFSNGILYIYPGLIPNREKGELTTIGNWHLWDSTTPSIVDCKKARALVKESMNFRLRFSYNMQVLTIHSSLIEKLKFQGQFFHSPYPDFYAMTVLLQEAKKILACPYPLTIVGVSPKSFGGHHINQREDLGMETLNVGEESRQYPELERIVLPGKKLNICWLYALRSAQKNLASSVNLRIGVQRFRKVQMLEFLRMIRNDTDRGVRLKELMERLRLWEKWGLSALLAFLRMVEVIKGQKFSHRVVDKILALLNTHPGHVNYQFKKDYDSILEVVKEVSPYECETYFIK